MRESMSMDTRITCFMGERACGASHRTGAMVSDVFLDNSTVSVELVFLYWSICKSRNLISEEKRLSCSKAPWVSIQLLELTRTFDFSAASTKAVRMASSLCSGFRSAACNAMFSPNSNTKAVLAPSLQREQFVKDGRLNIVADWLCKHAIEDGAKGQMQQMLLSTAWCSAAQYRVNASR